MRPAEPLIDASQASSDRSEVASIACRPSA